MAAKKTYTIGLSKIEVGAIAEDGGMGETLDVLGYTYQDTCTMTQEDPETTDHYAEEVDDPVISISRGGKTNFNFSIMNPSVTVLADLLGGVGTPGTGNLDKKNTAFTESCVNLTYEFHARNLEFKALFRGNAYRLFDYGDFIRSFPFIRR